MKINSGIPEKAKKKQENLTKMQETKYFCPRCRNLFLDGNFKKDDDNTYKCYSCKKEKIQTLDYKLQVRNGKSYHNDGSNNKVQQFIKESIYNLASQGFSARDIHQITHFSRPLISRHLKNISQIHEKKILVNNFLTNTLKLTPTDATQIIDSVPLPMKIKQPYIENALSHHLTYELIANIFQVSHRDIEKIRRKTSIPEIAGENKSKPTYHLVEDENTEKIYIVIKWIEYNLELSTE